MKGKEVKEKQRRQIDLICAIGLGVYYGYLLGDYLAKTRAKEAALMSRIYAMEAKLRTPEESVMNVPPMPVRIIKED